MELGAIVGAWVCVVAIVFHASVSAVCSRRDVSAIGNRASVLSMGIEALEAMGGAECVSFATFWLRAGEVFERVGVDRRVAGIERLRVLFT